MLSVYACVAGIGGLSVLIGHAVWRLAGGRGFSWSAPALGLATAMSVGVAAVRLPGHGWTVLGFLLALAVAGAVTLWPERAGHARAVGLAAVVAVVVTAALSLPFLLNDRLGLLGAHVLDDLGFHVAWAEALATGHGGFALIDRIQPGYPIGPHALVAGFVRPFGALAGFTGFLMAVPVLTALTALGALRGVAVGWRGLGAIAAGLPYLAVSYFAEGSFKEPAAALLVLGLVLVLADLSGPRRARNLLAPAILAVGCTVTFGLRGLVWPAALLLAWAVLEAVPRRHQLAGWLRRSAPLVAALAGALVVAAVLGASLLSVLSDIGGYHDTSAVGGNFVRTVSPLVGLGGWPVPDFRLAPDSTWKVVLATAVVLGALGVALVLARRRRDWLYFTAAAATLVVYAVSAAVSSPYLSVKTLAVVGPLLTVAIARELFPWDGSPSWRWIRRAAGLGFVAVLAWSSLTALRGAAVSAPASSDALRAQRSLLRHGPTLLLIDDHYARWELLDVPLWSPLPYGFRPDVPALRGIRLRPQERVRPYSFAPPYTFDFDSLPASVLDRFRFAVTANTPYASVPPPNWRLRRRLASIQVWERQGPTPPRDVPGQFGQPGAVLACAAGPRRGVAAVRPFPVLGPVGAWRIPGAAPPSGGAGPAPLPPGGEMSQRLELAPGTWSISLRYTSWVGLSLRAADLDARLPAVTDPPSQFRLAGTLHSRGGPVVVTVRADRGRRGLIARNSEIDALAATPAPWPERLVPLAQACGRYVDWFVT